MKKITLSLLALFCMNVCFAQVIPENYSHEYGKTTQYELDMKQYPGDSDAEAIVIHELGDFYFLGYDNEGFMLNMVYTIKIKILKQAGLKYADFEIPYYTEGYRTETVDMIEGHTLNYVDNKLNQTLLETSKIYEEKINDNWRVKKFAMPDVREGSVIELKYRITTPYFVNIRRWEFQKKIPVVRSIVSYKAIPYYEYTYIVKGTTKFDIFESGKESHDKRFRNLEYKELEYIFGMNKLPAFKDEEFITSPRDYMVGMEFQLSQINDPNGATRTYMSTWPEINDRLLKDKDYGGYINNSAKQGKKILPGLEISGKSNEEQIKIISTYVKNNFKFNNRGGIFANQSVDNFMKSKTGSSTEINLFLVGLMQSAGLSAEPVTISTRGHGAISKNHPFIQHLDYVVAMVVIGSSHYFLDATDPLLAYNELPEECINVQGLITNKDKEGKWVFTEQNTIAKTNHIIHISVQPEENKMNVTTEFEALGNDAYRYRRMYANNSNNFQDFIQKQTNLVLQDGIKIENEKDLSLPFKMSFKFNNPVENTGDKLFIHPFAGLAIKNNMFKQSSRKSIVDLVFLRGNKYTSTIEIPAGYKVEYLPESSSTQRTQMHINYTVSQSGNTIIIEADYEFMANMYTARDYMPLKVIVDEAIKKINEMIVLVKE